MCVAMEKGREDTDENVKDNVTQTFPPSHILQDGRFIYLPEPSNAERSGFLERTIARHGLLKADLKSSEEDDENEDDKNDNNDNNKKKPDADGKAKEQEEDETTQPKIHPLAVASARLQANGVAELSKAVNLSGLVSTGEYFGLTNIVNPVLDVPLKDGKAEQSPAATADMQEEQRLRATYVGKRKRAQFEKAAEALQRHERRMAAAVAAQTIVDQRLLQLRPQWRLVAPEHGTRAKAHPVRPTEVVAIDVDVYDRDRTGGGNLALTGNNSVTTRGRLARRVPRFATVELLRRFDVGEDLKQWKEVHSMDQEDVAMTNGEDQTNKTRAEPFAVADPTMGKIDIDFDPEKVPMLSLQLDIEKDSTGFRQSACLSPLTTLGENASDDEKVVVALQHSLFCASLFESIRRELAPYEENEDDQFVWSGAAAATKHQSHVWMPGGVEENFLPAPTYMAGAEGMGGKGALSVVHYHEGEVKVQLDVEYALTVKLVEAGTDPTMDAMQVDNGDDSNGQDSGSQSHEQLHSLCRALLVHAQDVYHSHSIETRAFLKKKAKEQSEKPRGLERKKKKDEIPPARILQKCVCLGAKLLFEHKVRITLSVRNKNVALLFWALSLVLICSSTLRFFTHRYRKLSNGCKRRATKPTLLRLNGCPCPCLALNHNLRYSFGNSSWTPQ